MYLPRQGEETVRLTPLSFRSKGPSEAPGARVSTRERSAARARRHTSRRAGTRAGSKRTCGSSEDAARVCLPKEGSRKVRKDLGGVSTTGREEPSG
jgi:hypothetical protein